MIPAQKLTAAVETYFSDLRRLRASGGATGERSSYVPLANLLNAVGAALKPKVFCVVELADQGSGHPDIGLYASKQVQRGKPREGQVPERGVVEVKSPRVELGAPEAREQVDRYWSRYRLVLLTNLREFGVVGRNSSGDEVKLEALHARCPIAPPWLSRKTLRGYVRPTPAMVSAFWSIASPTRLSVATS